MNSKFTEFNLDPGAYVAFDATSLRTLIVNRLKSQGIFTDQIFEGSNLASIIDVISYSFHTLMFYLNKTSNESMFTEAQLYENMNRIVKLLNYKPVGFQTSVLSYDATIDAELPIGTYTIPRYTTVDVDGIPYSFPQDITFAKPTTGTYDVDSNTSQFLLYQGEVVEYPQYVASGEDFETIIISLDPTAVKIDHFNIDVYIKTQNGDITRYEETQSLYTESSGAARYEKRLNESMRYELKFGNDINARKLQSGDVVMIYYIKSSGDDGLVGAGALIDKSLTLYTTPQYNLIRSMTKTDDIIYLDFDSIKNIKLKNSLPSTDSKTEESVLDMRNHAPQHFLSQDRLITADDFTTHIRRNFGNIITSAVAISNEAYISGHLDYLMNVIGLNHPVSDSRVLFNQAHFSTTTNFNNVYVYCVPRTNRKTSINIQNNFLPVSQKELLRGSINKSKSIGLDIVFSDPVYMAIDLGVSASDTLTSSSSSKTAIQVIKSPGIIRNNDAIRQEISDVLINYFSAKTCSLGQEIEVDQILSDMMSIDGVQSIRTVRRDVSSSVSGLSLLIWNPVYESRDIHTYNQNVQLPYYKFPYFFDELTLLSRIDVIDSVV